MQENNKYSALLRRIDAALLVLKGEEVYYSNGKPLLRDRGAKGRFSTGKELPKILPNWMYSVADKTQQSLLTSKQYFDEIIRKS